MNTNIMEATVKHASERVYQYMLQDHTGNWGMDIEHWDWVPGVGVISILEYYKSSGSEAVINQLIKWAKSNIHKSEQVKVINSIAPFAIFPELYRHTQDPVFLETATRIANWMMSEAPRTREGAFEHTVTENASFPEQVWADTIFMAVLFLARLSRLTGEAAYGEEAIRQLNLHLELLQDEATGVLFHGWSCIAQNHMSSARWTRANAWIAVGTPMILQELEDLVIIPKETLERYRTLMRGLISFQQENGLWATVMDHPGYYSETSGSAGIACGILKAVRLGLLEEAQLNAAQKTLNAVIANIKVNGEVASVSSGTPVMPTIEAYNEIPCYPSLYGQGLVLMLLSECLVQK
jgi:unsaturated rhamnogalacturonyl hydrolase